VVLNSPNNNIIFADVGEGDNIGQLELYLKCVIDNLKIGKVLSEERKNYHYFTVQALTDC
jgi:hypothetical protein